MKVKNKEMKSYMFQDEAPVEGVNIYRIKLVTKDGNSVYSNQEEVLFELTHEEITIFPNPTVDQITVNLASYVGRSALIEVYNNAGVLAQNKKIEEILTATHSLNLTSLIDGKYWMRIQIDGHRLMTKPFVVIKR